MNLADTNVLLYAVNEDSQHHQDSRRWLDGELSRGSTVAFAWIALLAFLRLSTKVGLFPFPLTIEQALDRVDAWLSAPSAVVVEPRADHARVLRGLLAPLGTAGNLTSDAHLAALAVEHHAVVVTYDSDIIRFDGVSSVSPTQLLGGSS